MKIFNILSLLLAVVPHICDASTPSTPNHPDSVYIFTYTTPNNPKEGIKIAYSSDKENWIEIGNHSFVKSDFGTWGGQKNMYSPSVVRKDNHWYAIWSLNDRNNQFATTHTLDFVAWKPQDYPYMHNKENVLEPNLNIVDDKFVVTYRTSQGNFYSTESKDFKQWSEPKIIDSSTNKSRRSTLLINGLETEGEIHRAEWQLVNKLINTVHAIAYRNQLNDERMADDTRRFRNLKSVNATLNVNQSESKDISSELIGIFFEDINYAADGGIYAELIQNRDFEYSRDDNGGWNQKTAWNLIGEGTTWSISTEEPIHENNKHYSVLKTTKPGALLSNSGFDGIALNQGEKYDLSVFLRSLDSKTNKIRVRLIEGNKIISQTTLNVQKNWKQQKVTLTAQYTTKNAQLTIEPIKEGEVAIDFVSLFPQKTFKNRPNGLRADLAQTLADLHPQFVRFPGGCATHGNGIDNIYRWKNTIGPLHTRKGDFNIWGYHQSMGLGFYEYFQFCEDIGAEPLPVLAAGVPCQNSSRGGDGQQGGIPMDQMDEYLQELLDLIEWANGDAKKSPLAKMRADAGHPKPFNLKYLGIGNEDLISDVFTERYLYLCKEISKRHPEITVIGTVGPFFEGSDYEWGWKIAKEENLKIVDEHYYNNPGWYINNQQFYDKYERNSTKVYLGEYASRGNNLENALAEAIHITNLERNADVVVMSSYAPLLAKEGHTQWNPDLIYFNNTEVMPTVNYYVQMLCGQNSGDKYIGNQLTLDNRNPEVRKRVSTSVVKDSKTGDLIIKIVNSLPVNMSTTINVGSTDDFENTAKVNILTGKINERGQTPTESSIEITGNTKYDVPAYSFNVIRIKAKAKKK